MIPIITDTHLKRDNVEDNLKVYRLVVNWCVENNQKTVIHIGDVFDSRKAQSEFVLNTFFDILEMFWEKKITLVCIPGNHDKTDYSSVSSFLRPFQTHPAFTYIQDTYGYEHQPGHYFWFIPFFNHQEYQYRLQLLLKEKTLDNNSVNTLFTHIGVNGATMNNGKQVDGIGVDLFRQFDKVLVGHYHDVQSLDDKRIIYIGASLQHNFGEEENKGIVLYNPETMSIKTLPLDTKKYETIEVDIDKMSFEYVEGLKKLKDTENIELRLVLIGEEDKIKSFNKNELLKHGIHIQTKPTKIKREDIQERVEPFTESNIYDEWTSFCKNNQLNKKVGEKYLNKVFNV